MNVTFKLTLYATTFPFSTSASCSLTQALLTFRSVSLARSMPWTIASSKLFGEVALISTTRATDIRDPPARRVRKEHAPRRSYGSGIDVVGRRDERVQS